MRKAEGAREQATVLKSRSVVLTSSKVWELGFLCRFVGDTMDGTRQA